MLVSHYQVLGRLGAGGMGEVFRAVDTRLGRQVALKFLGEGEGAVADEERRLRLLREAQAASALNHPGIVTLHDIGTHEGRPFLVMEYVEGEPFSALVRQRIDPREALLLCAEAADALGAAHARGILHRDVKSDNLMRTRDGRVKVLDFGLAKLRWGEPPAAVVVQAGASVAGPRPPSGRVTTGEGGVDAGRAEALALEQTIQTASRDATPRSSSQPSGEVTRAGDIMGTPAYMAPEQAAGRPVDARSEIFSLGVVAYELLTGRRPFKGATLDELLRDLGRARPQPPSAAAGRPLPRGVDDAILTALAGDPDDRFRDMGELAHALRKVAGAAPLRRRLLVGAVAALALVVAVAAVALTLSSREASGPRGAAGPAVEPAPAAPPAPGGTPDGLEATVRSLRVRRVTSDDGCEEFPVFSPDGRRLLYDGVRGDGYAIWALDLDTGDRRPLTDGSAWDYAPALSPDGERLAFVRRQGDDVATVITDAEAREPAVRLATGNLRPAWSPDGRAVWAGEGEAPARWDLASRTAGRTLRVLPGTAMLHLRELPDGRVAGLYLPADASATGAGLLVYGADVGQDEPRPLAQAELAEVLAVTAAGEVAVSHVTAGGSVELWRVPLDGSPTQVLPGSSIVARAGLAMAPGRVAWSDCETRERIALLGAVSPGGPLRAIPIERGRWMDRDPATIPGSDRIIVVSNQGGRTQLWEVDPERRTPARVIPTGALEPRAPAVSSDGQEIFFATDGGIFAVPRDGSREPRAVRPGSELLFPAPTRDGAQVVLERRAADGGPRVGVVAALGGPIRDLVKGPATEPTASPVDDAVAFVALESVDGAVGRIEIIDRPGAAPRPLSRDLTPGAYSILRFAPDGQRLAFVRGSAQLLEVDRRTGAVLRTFESGTDQISGIAYAGSQLVVSLVSWTGDIFVGEVQGP